MELRLVASWTCRVADLPFRGWLRIAPGHVGVHGADGCFTIWHDGAALASIALPDATVVGLDPRGEVVAVAVGERVELRAITGSSREASAPAGFVARAIEFRPDGERLWVLGTIDDRFAVCGFDRALTAMPPVTLALSQGPFPTTIHVHPHEDAFVLTTNEDGREPDAAPLRRGVVLRDGALHVVFEVEIDHPCVGFTRDGSALIGLDAYQGVMRFTWPDYAQVATATLSDGVESRFDGAVLAEHVLAEQHTDGEPGSSVWVLALPALDEVARLPWDGDDFGLDIAGALGPDQFLDARCESGDTWRLRVWALMPAYFAAGTNV